MNTKTPQNSWNRNAGTGVSKSAGPYIAEVMKNDDPLYSGRLLVYIADFGGDPDNEDGWILVRYMSPYYGIQPLSNRQQSNNPNSSKKFESYGMWMQPPDLGVKVLVIFANNDRSDGFWIGCIPEIGSHAAIPGQDRGDFDLYADGNFAAASENIKGIERPEHSTASQFESQGIQDDEYRGPITSSSFRESPSRVFGFNTPGGHSLVLDDGDESSKNNIIRIRTGAGNQITMNDDNGMIYMINRDGTGWIEISPSGHIDVYGKKGINIATPGDMNFHADGNIKIHANKDLQLISKKTTKLQGSDEVKISGSKLKATGLQGIDFFTNSSCLIKAGGQFGVKAGNFLFRGSCFKWNTGSPSEAKCVPLLATKEKSGYQTTVSRAPNSEPWDEHDNASSSSEPATEENTQTEFESLAAFGGAGPDVVSVSSAESLDAFGGAGPDVSSAAAAESLDAFGGAGPLVIPGVGIDESSGAESLDAFGGAGPNLDSTSLTENNIKTGVPKTSVQQIKKSQMQIPKSFSNSVNTVVNSLSKINNIADDLSNTVGSVTKLINDPVSGITNAVDDITGGIVSNVSNLADDVGNFVSNPIGSVVGGLSDSIDNIAGDIGGIASGLSDSIDNIAGDIGGIASGLSDSIGSVVGGLSDSIDNIAGDIGGIAGDISGAASELLGQDSANLAQIPSANSGSNNADCGSGSGISSGNSVSPGSLPSGISGNPQAQPGITPEKSASIKAFAEKYNIDPNALAGKISIESGFDPSIQGGAGNNYHGIFQLSGGQVPELTKRAFGRALSPAEFRKLSFEDQLKVYDQYLQKWNITSSHFTGNAAQDASRLWALQLSPAKAKSINYNDPNAVISNTRQAASISSGGRVTVGSVQASTIESGGLLE